MPRTERSCSTAETGKRVRISGFDEWTMGAEGLVAESLRHYDEAEYDRQLQHGIDQSPGESPVPNYRVVFIPD
jgi:hypothetical protein